MAKKKQVSIDLLILEYLREEYKGERSHEFRE